MPLSEAYTDWGRLMVPSVVIADSTFTCMDTQIPAWEVSVWVQGGLDRVCQPKQICRCVWGADVFVLAKNRSERSCGP